MVGGCRACFSGTPGGLSFLSGQGAAVTSSAFYCFASVDVARLTSQLSLFGLVPLSCNYIIHLFDLLVNTNNKLFWFSRKTF